MNGQQLHFFDQGLCRSIATNISASLTSEDRREEFANEFGRDLLAYMLDPRPDMLLGLWEEALLQPRLDHYFSAHVWEPDTCLYRQVAYTSSDIRKALGIAHADEWNSACSRFIRRLSKEGLDTATGVELSFQWCLLLWHYLLAMGATEFVPAPDGEVITPVMFDPPASQGSRSCLGQPKSFSGSAEEIDKQVSAGTADLLEALIARLDGPATPHAEALSKEDAARFLGLDVGSIEYLIRTRKLGYVQCGNQRRRVIPVESLRRFLAENYQMTGTELRDRRRKL